jgi:nucleotide-binding universal stress UspA family protein
MVGPAGKAGALPPSIHFETEDEAIDLVEAAVGRLRVASVEAQGRVGPGSASTARELLAIAADYGATAIIVAQRGGQVSEVLLGSVAHRVVHLATIPVLVVR